MSLRILPRRNVDDAVVLDRRIRPWRCLALTEWAEQKSRCYAEAVNLEIRRGGTDASRLLSRHERRWKDTARNAPIEHRHPYVLVERAAYGEFAPRCFSTNASDLPPPDAAREVAAFRVPHARS